MAGEQDNSRRSGLIRGYVFSFFIKVVLGVTLLVCAGLANTYTSGQEDTFGPPYYIGGFVVGPLISLSAVIQLCLCCRLCSLSDEGNHGDKEWVQYYLKMDMVASVFTLMGCFLGVFFAGIFGVKDCDPTAWGSHCNYVNNMSENRTLAIVILISILASAVVTIASCCFVQRRVLPFLGIQNTRFRMGGPLVIVGGNTGAQTSFPPPENVTNADGVPVYNHAKVSVNMQDYGTSGPPAAYTWQGATPGGTAGFTPGGTAAATGGMGMNESVQQLQERNRLLQENIRLQREQLELQRQIQQGSQIPPPQPMSYPPGNPPPPSYDSCISDPGQFQQLQQHTRQLEEEYHRQQQLLTEKPQNFSQMSPGYNSGVNIAPSAPPPQ